MIELFTIFGKGGIVLWCFQECAQLFTDSINKFIQEQLLQERGDVKPFHYNNMTIKFHMDNEFELVYMVVYQSIVQLSYGDKLIDSVSLRFRDLFKNVLENRQMMYIHGRESFTQFDEEFQTIFHACVRESLEDDNRIRKPKSFQESAKSQKTVESLIISRPGDVKKKNNGKGRTDSLPISDSQPSKPSIRDSPQDDDELLRKRNAFFKKTQPGSKKTPTTTPEPQQSAKKKGKEARLWELGGSKKDHKNLDYSNPENKENLEGHVVDSPFVEEQRQFVGRSFNLEALRESDSEEDTDVLIESKVTSSGWLSSLKNLVGNKKITSDDICPILEKMKENLILKNVAAEPADQICQSVGRKLEGKVIGTFTRVHAEVKEAVRESLTQLLTPRRRVDILRDIIEAKREDRPYVIVFCGVNGVGKSTNLAKITFWLNENGHRVLIAAGDTFRAGAVEQLRTHSNHLNSLHPNSVELFEQGYGKDPSGIAASAIVRAAEKKCDVVLVDTAGRMQDNEPLMRALSKLIRINEPDLCLFVGEALVGNEAVDQLVKFNQALSDHSAPGSEPHLIDGIVLTKFDTIDDKVGAAISMTYITGQPIVFVGCGQTYKDLKNLNVSAVVSAILK